MNYPAIIINPGTELAPFDARPIVGDEVIVYSRGRYREVIVERSGPKNIVAAYTTPAAVENGRKYGHDPVVTRKTVPHDAVYRPAGSWARARFVVVAPTSEPPGFSRRASRSGAHRLEPAPGRDAHGLVPDELSARAAAQERVERCPVCGQPDNCGDCNHA